MKKSVNTFLLYYLPLILWMGVIFFGSSFTGSPRHGHLELGELLLRKGAHVTEYFILTVLFFRVAWRHVSGSIMRALATAVVFSLLYAVSDELHQLFVLYREGKLSDVGIDGIGMLFALAVIYGLYRKDGRGDS